jgi:hypothetical protein
MAMQKRRCSWGETRWPYLLRLEDQWGTIWAVHIRMWSLARLITDQIAAANTDRSALVKLASEIAYLAGGLKTQRARLGMLIETLAPFSDETSTAEQVARDVLGQDSYADVEKRGSRLSPERFEGAANRVGYIVDRHIPACHKERIELADFVGGRTGSRHPGRSRLAQQRHRSAPRNREKDHRRANAVNFSKTDDRLT